MGLGRSEPCRGLGGVQGITATQQNGRQVVVSTAGPEPYASTSGLLFVDRAPWEAAPAGGLTLTLSWATGTGTPTTGPFQVLEVSAVIPGDPVPAAGAGHWIYGTPGTDLPASGSATRTLTFDDAPLDTIAGAARAGMLELYVLARRTSAIAYTIDSRDAVTGTFESGWTAGRGYVRARSKLQSLTVARATPGADDTSRTFAYPDTPAHRVTLDVPLYRPEPITVAHHNGLGGTYRSAPTPAVTAAQRDVTMASTTGALTDRVDTRAKAGGSPYPAAQPVQGDVILPARDSWEPAATVGGDNETAWADTGHAAGWALNDPGPSGAANRTLRKTPLLTVDPRVTLATHLQVNDNALARSKDTGTSRQVYDLGFVSAAASNARGEPLPAITLAYSFADIRGLIAAKTASGAANAEGLGPSLGWADQLPAGAWENTVTASDPAGQQAIASHRYTLLAINPSYRLVVGASLIASPPDHFTPGDTLTVGLMLRDRAAGTYAPIDATPPPDVTILRYDAATGKGQYLAADNTWKDLVSAAGETAATKWSLARSATDGNLWLRSFTQTAGWGYLDMFVIGVAQSNGTPYTGISEVAAVGPYNPHGRLLFDPTGLFS